MTDKIICEVIIIDIDLPRCSNPATHAYFDEMSRKVIYRCDDHQMSRDPKIVEINEIPFEEASLYEVMNA